MQGLIMRSTGSWYDILGEDQQIYQGRLRGKFKIQGLKVTNPIAVGDWIQYELESFGGTEMNAVITDILPRTNYIIRKSVHKTAHGHMLAANVDQSIIIATLAYPRTSLGFIDRFLVTNEAFRIPTIIVFNKIDLLDEESLAYLDDLKKMYEKVGYQCLFTSITENIGIEILEETLKNKKTLISGHSGVGKSSFINKLVPELALKTSAISDFANKGVHTTTFAEMFQLDKETFIIDTPGIKELGIVDIADEELSHYFPEMRDLLGLCKFYNCKHIHEPNCAVIEAVDQGKIAQTRYNSYLSMLENTDNRR